MKLSDALAVQTLGDHAYALDVQPAFCNGKVSHGGYTASVVLAFAAQHFASTLAHLDQPDTLTAHIEYLRRLAVGRVECAIDDTKLGGDASTVHVTLRQGTKVAIAAYVTRVNFAKARGFSFKPQYTLDPAPQPVDLAALARGTDPGWVLYQLERDAWTMPTTHVDFGLRRDVQHGSPVGDEWVRFRNPAQRWTNECLGYLADMWPQVVDSYRVGSPYSAPGMVANAVRARGAPVVMDPRQTAQWVTHWYATLVVNLEMKKALPPDGVEWLYARTVTKQIKDGRLDLEVIMCDDKMDLVCVSHQIVMIFEVARNLAQPKPGKATL